MVKAEHRKQIDKIMAEITCRKHFRCVESGFENLCKARDFGGNNYLDCLEADPAECPFAMRFDDQHLCECPLRVYLAKKLGK